MTVTTSSSTIDWLHWLVKARQIDAFLGRELKRFEISPSEYEILATLKDGSLTQTEIGERIQHSMPSVSRRLQRLDGKDWIIRETPTRDRRRLLVSLTDQGNKHLCKVESGLEKAVAELISTLGASELHFLTGLYDRIETLLSVGREHRKSEP